LRAPQLEEDKMMMNRNSKQAFRFRLLTALLAIGLLVGLVGNAAPVQAGAGDFTITHKAARPSDYIPDVPYPGLVVAPPIGRANGELLIPGARFATGVASLNPQYMAFGQIVPFEFEIKVGAGAVDADLPICYVYKWGTTSLSAFGYDPAFGILTAFVDTSETIRDDGDPATVTFLKWDYNDSSTNYITATICVGGLQPLDHIVVEAWSVLMSNPVPKMGSNTDSRAVSAWTDTGAAISYGANAIPLNQVQDFATADVWLSVYKFDDNKPKPIYWGTAAPTEAEMWKNTIVVTAGPDGDTTTDYVANGVVITDTLDEWVKIVDTAYYDATDHPYGINIDAKLLRTCSYVPLAGLDRGGTLTCNLNAVPEGGSSTVTVEYYTVAVPGVPIGSTCEGLTETSPATSVAAECPITQLSPRGYDVMNRVTLTTYSDDKTPNDNWDEEPKDINYPNAVEIEYFIATGQSRSILLEWKTVTEMNNLGFNLYRAFRIDGPRVKINAELIPSNIFGQGGAVYEYLDTGLFPNRTYYYWLEDVDFNETTTLYGPVDAKPTRK